MDVDLTFLVTDIEDSTALWAADSVAMERVLARHDTVLRTAIEAHGGTVFKGTGDGFLSVFPDPTSAVEAAAEAQEELRAEHWPQGHAIRVRMGLDTGPAEERSGDYFGPSVNRVVRVMSSGHGGQILLTEETADSCNASTIELGDYDYKGVGRVTVHQLLLDGLEEFPELRTDRTSGGAVRDGLTVPIRGYEVRRVLGEGDFGVVYQAHQASVGREVAVKVIRPEYANQPSFIKRFEIEAQFVAQLEHPHIVPLYDFWRDPDGAYLVMRLLRGGSLRTSIARSTWTPSATARLLTEVGSALGYAHRSGVIHRDLKPENVLLDEDGNAYLTDFGIAVRRSAKATAPTSTSQAYRSPEEIAGQRLSSQSDIFGLGVLTHELLTGTLPETHTGRLVAAASIRDPYPAIADAIERAIASDPTDRFDKVEGFVAAIEEATGTAAPVQAPETSAVRNPFKGLRSFQETDQADFFGRDHLIDEILARVRDQPLTAVVGPSGSGKSSVVRAGLLPAVRSGGLGQDRDWLIATLFPGSYPFEELGAALLRVAVDRPSQLIDDLAADELGLVRACKRILPQDESGLLLVIDQFEELFSLASRAESDRFMAALVALAADARSRTKVVLTFRADYFNHPLDHPEFAKLITSGLVTVAVPDEAELAEAVTLPAEAAGLELEPGLVATVVTDVSGQPGGLPLMQYTLTELVRHRDGRQLTMSAYRDAGGVLGALGKRAEETYSGLDDRAREAARQLFLRLVSVDEHSDDTRRRVKRTDLDALGLDPAALAEVLETFGSFRLLTFDVDPLTREPTVEVAHEALIREWPRLDGWIGEHREDLVLEQRLGDALAEWDRADRDISYLLRGSRLEQFEEWATGSKIRLTDQQREFLEASIAARETERAAEAARLAHERELEQRSRTRLQVLVAVTGLAAVIAAVLGFIALQQANEADTQRIAAEDERDRSEELRLIAEEQQAILDQQVVAFEAAALAETAMEMIPDDGILAVGLAQEAIVAAHQADYSLDRAVAALHVALQDSGVQFPPGEHRWGKVRGPDGLRGVFLIPVGDLLDLVDSSGLGVLAEDACREYLRGPCPATPVRDRLPGDVLESTVLPGTTSIPGLEGTDLSYIVDLSSSAGPAIGRSLLDDVFEEGMFAELLQFSQTFGIDATGRNISQWGRLFRGGETADYGLILGSTHADFVRRVDEEVRTEGTFSLVESGSLIRVTPLDIEAWLDPSLLLLKEPAVATEPLRSALGLQALWISWHPWTVVYRTDIFAGEGLAPPESRAELMALSQALTDRGWTPWCFGGAGSTETVLAMVGSDVLAVEGPGFYDQWLSHEAPADSPRFVAAFQRLDELLFTPGHLDTTRDVVERRPHTHARVDLAGEDPACVMWFTSADLSASIELPLGHFLLPGLENSPPSVLAGGTTIVFWTDRPETRVLARWLTTIGFGPEHLDSSPLVVANTRLIMEERNGPAVPSELLSGFVGAAMERDRFRIAPISNPRIPSSVLDAYSDAIERWILEGPEVLPEALAEVEAIWQEWEAEHAG